MGRGLARPRPDALRVRDPAMKPARCFGQRLRRAKPKPPNKRSMTRIRMIHPVVLICFSPSDECYPIEILEYPPTGKTKRWVLHHLPGAGTFGMTALTRHLRGVILVLATMVAAVIASSRDLTGAAVMCALHFFSSRAPMPRVTRPRLRSKPRPVLPNVSRPPVAGDQSPQIETRCLLRK